jgi:hypothetical protein
MNKTKVCTKCGEEHPATAEYFTKNKMGKYGLYSICKTCQYCKKECNEHCEKYNSEYHENKNKKTKICIKCGEELPATLENFHKHGNGLRNDCKVCNNKKKKQWHEENKEYVIIKNRNWYSKNKEIQYKRHKKWRKENKEIVNKSARELMARKCDEDPKFRLNKNMRTAIWRSLKGNKNGARWELLVGYTTEQLKEHLEKQFQYGMEWGNYGNWHVDHERPISSFNFTSPEDPEFKQCWALENLQPLWAEDNIRKNGKWKAS